MKEAACFQEKLMGGDRLLVVTAGLLEILARAGGWTAP